MNYRHAYHAGNFADVMKHAILVRVLVHLLKKETPFRVIDTHAGIGRYDLSGEEAERTGEWRAGIRLFQAPFAPEVEGLIAPYRGILAETQRRHGPQAYPGSPAIIREMLRRQDRAVFVEKHPVDGAILAERFNMVANIKVMLLDGWTALRALVPPKERRGLVLIDPPYEEPGGLDQLGQELVRVASKWPTGIYMAWYPIKSPSEIDRVAHALDRASPRKGLRLDLVIERPDDPDRLNGCGLFVLNPPWTLEEEAALILPALAERFAQSTYGAYRCERLGSWE